jgi:hypothetical protein
MPVWLQIEVDIGILAASLQYAVETSVDWLLFKRPFDTFSSTGVLWM